MARGPAQGKPGALLRPRLASRPKQPLLGATGRRETAWQMELKGDVTRQRRLEAIDKLLSVLTLIVGSVFGLQALGLDGGWAGMGEGRPAAAALASLTCSGIASHKVERCGGPLTRAKGRRERGGCLLPLAARPPAHCGPCCCACCPGCPPQSTRCWPLAGWAAWRWAWRGERFWRTCSPGSSSSPQTPSR